MDAVVAVYEDWGIGAGGTQPISLKADRKHFRQLTEGRTVLVGRRTLEDFPGGKPLQGRRNLILTRRQIQIPEAEIIHSPDEAAGTDCIVIGGASVYRQLFPFIDRVYVTKLRAVPVSDSFFPDLDSLPDWQCTSQSEWYSEDRIEYCFCVYERCCSGEAPNEA